MKTMRKAFSWLLALMMIISTSVSLAETEYEEDQIDVERKVVPAYFGSMEAETEFTICLLNDVDDLPWITPEDLRELLVLFYGVYNNDQKYELEISTEDNGKVVKLWRENGSFLEFDSLLLRRVNYPLHNRYWILEKGYFYHKALYHHFFQILILAHLFVNSFLMK